MTRAAGVRASVEACVGPIRALTPVGGGCIGDAFRAETARAGTIFLKVHPAAPPRMFATERDGLLALRVAAGEHLRVPGVVAVDEEGGDAARWIALEWLEPGARGCGFGERLGRGLAAVHRAAGSGWGWTADNYIGSLAQENAPAATWAGFWRDRRLGAQLRAARALGRDPGPAREWERLFDRLPALLAPAEGDGPSLVHGDLWSGNVLSAAGEPALIDPAVHHGHREVDLAMAELFGGFDASFFAAYREAWPQAPGYAEARRSIYQLYFLLVHLTLFGGGYAGQVRETLRRALAA